MSECLGRLVAGMLKKKPKRIALPRVALRVTLKVALIIVTLDIVSLTYYYYYYYHYYCGYSRTQKVGTWL